MSIKKILRLIVLLSISSLVAIYLYSRSQANRDGKRKRPRFTPSSRYYTLQKATMNLSKAFDRLDRPRSYEWTSDWELSQRQHNMSVEDMRAYNRSAEYCNPVERLSIGEEGAVPQEYKLLSAHIITRHGDRSPWKRLPNHEQLRLHCVLDSTLSETYKPLLVNFLAAMEQFGGGIPHRDMFGLYPKRKVCGEAQMTGHGALQHLVTGDHLRKIYIDQHGLMSAHPKPGEIRIKSTGYSRTYQSALSIIYGLLPEYRLKQNDLKMYSNLFFCDRADSGVTCNCPAVHKLETLSEDEQAVTRSNNSALLDSIKRELSAIHEISKSEVPFMWSIMDVLMGYVCHKRPLPCGQRHDQHGKSCYSLALIGKIWDYLDRRSVSGEIGYKHHLLLMYPLLREITLGMMSVTQRSNRAKLTLYSGHDLTIKSLLKALGILDGRWPPYASRVVFELYSNSGTYFVRILYNGKDITRFVNFCSKSDLTDNLCPFSALRTFILRDSLTLFGESSYEKICLKETF